MLGDKNMKKKIYVVIANIYERKIIKISWYEVFIKFNIYY